MAVNRVILSNSNAQWRLNGRYKVNNVVRYLGVFYQNTTGKNTIPNLLQDWFLLTESNVSVYSEMFVYSGGAKTFTMDNNVKVLIVLLNLIPVQDSDYTVSGNILTFVSLLKINDELIIKGVK